MASDLKSNPYESSILEGANKQLLGNQAFLFNENQKLQEDVSRLSTQLDHLRQTTVNPEIYETLRKEKEHLIEINRTLKDKIQNLRLPPVPLDEEELQVQRQEHYKLFKYVEEIEQMLKDMKHNSQRLIIHPPQESVADTIKAHETLRKLRDDDEKYILRDKITDMKQLVTDLEVENTKLKFECEQLSEDVNRYKKDFGEAADDVKAAKKKCRNLEDEKDKLKQIISNLEDDNLKLKKEMIVELNEANRAKRVSIDTELALQHISEAYDNKRAEVKQLREQLDDAEKIIKSFKEQFQLKL
ncbi:hypothetical protein NQ317_006674 [Molorchus minor]|uniref:Uncharacterized protein n=1 Tax=Molorchus minor TaxID=1323400 RepID=A0ABQ9JYA4_9CUCU|nr:hypothetical protein NQ317_006674 [Molorchus minor]